MTVAADPAGEPEAEVRAMPAQAADGLSPLERYRLTPQRPAGHRAPTNPDRPGHAPVASTPE
jgi:hypothetical protein